MRTASAMPPLGLRAAPFELPDTAGCPVSLADFDGSPVLVVCFLCEHCEYTRHVAAELGRFAVAYDPRGVAVVGINSNDDTYAEDAPDRMAATAARHGWAFPYLYDATQAVARAYRAACTPDFFLFDAARLLQYRGQFDPSRPGSGAPATGHDLRAAADAVLANTPPPAEQHPSVGCNIKWRAGAEPEYFHPSFVERVVRRLRRRG